MPLVLYEVRDRVAYITLNRPEKLNSINEEVKEGLFEAFNNVREDPDVWAAIITGNGRAFSTGHDLIEMGAGGGRHSIRTTEEVYQFIQETYKPIIAAINGICLAQGGGIALSCDIRIASEEAQFGWPQVKRGISSTSGPTLLAQMLPMNIALEFLYTGKFITAPDALRLGLVNKLVPRDQVMSAAEEFVRTIFENAPLAMRAVKEIAVRGRNMRLEDRVRFSHSMSTLIKQTEDAKEGLAAFREKRQPVYRGR